MKRPRPHYGNAFEYDRILNVFFYTSNTDKLLQARLLFMRHGYELKHFRGMNKCHMTKTISWARQGF